MRALGITVGVILLLAVLLAAAAYGTSPWWLSAVVRAQLPEQIEDFELQLQYPKMDSIGFDVRAKAAAGGYQVVMNAADARLDYRLAQVLEGRLDQLTVIDLAVDMTPLPDSGTRAAGGSDERGPLPSPASLWSLIPIDRVEIKQGRLTSPPLNADFSVVLTPSELSLSVKNDQIDGSGRFQRDGDVTARIQYDTLQAVTLEGHIDPEELTFSMNAAIPEMTVPQWALTGYPALSESPLTGARVAASVDATGNLNDPLAARASGRVSLRLEDLINEQIDFRLDRGSVELDLRDGPRQFDHAALARLLPADLLAKIPAEFQPTRVTLSFPPQLQVNWADDQWRSGPVALALAGAAYSVSANANNCRGGLQQPSVQCEYALSSTLTEPYAIAVTSNGAVQANMEKATARVATLTASLKTGNDPADLSAQAVVQPFEAAFLVPLRRLDLGNLEARIDVSTSIDGTAVKGQIEPRFERYRHLAGGIHSGSISNNVKLTYGAYSARTSSGGDWTWDGQQLSFAQLFSMPKPLNGAQVLARVTDDGDWRVELPAYRIKINGNLIAQLITGWTEPYDIFSGHLTVSAALHSSAGQDNFVQLDFESVSGTVDESGFAGLKAIARISEPLTGLRVEPTVVRIDLVDIGIGIRDVQADVLADAETLSLRNLRGRLLGGTGRVDELTYHWQLERSFFDLWLEDIELSALLSLDRQQTEASELYGTGTLHGKLPVQYDAGLIKVVDGEIHARPPGGAIRYRPAGLADYAKQPQLAMAFSALENFQYRTLDAIVNYQESGEIKVVSSVFGSSPKVENGRPVRFNFTITENVATLLESLRIADDIETRLMKKLKKRL